jgi:hypothetical protein
MKIDFFQKIQYSFWESVGTEQKKEWKLGRMIINENFGKKMVTMFSNNC